MKNPVSRSQLLRGVTTGLFGIALAMTAGMVVRQTVGCWLQGRGRPVPPIWKLPLGRPIRGAHRGGGALFPENTLAAFSGSYCQYGCRLLDLDLHVTRDGVPVVVHDDTVDRTTDGTGPVQGFDLSDLQHLDAGYRFRSPDGASWAGRGLHIPTVAEVISRFPNAVFSIEIKEAGEHGEAALVETIRQHGASERVIVGSAHDNTVSRLQAMAPEIPTFYSYWSGFHLISAYWLGLSRWYVPTHNALFIPQHLFGLSYIDKEFIDAMHRMAMPVVVWTINDAAAMRKLTDMGVDGILTDRPDLLAQAVPL